jgi:hypothetical protein
MAVQFPGALKTFTKKVDLQSLVVANDVNEAYDEITAIETTLGLNPATSGTWGSGTFSSASTVWADVSTRIQNVENAAYYLNGNTVIITGGSQILPTTTSVVNLSLKAYTGQTANMLEVRNSSNTLTARVSAAGEFIINIDGGTA